MNEWDKEKIRKQRIRKNRERKQQVRKQRFMLACIGAGAILSIVAVTSISGAIHQRAQKAAEAEAAAKAAAEAEAKERELAIPNEVTICAVGDNIMHENLNIAAKQKDGSYDYSYLYENVRNKIQQADIAVVNQETVLVEKADQVEGYPNFGTYQSMGDALADCGFDVVLQASNHAGDKGIEAIENTVDYWENAHPEISMLGMHEKDADTKTAYITKNGITFAMADFAYGINDVEVPVTREEAAPYVDFISQKSIDAYVSEAKNKSDVVVVYLHAGREEDALPNDYVLAWTKYLADAGVDITIITHTHVVNPYEMVSASKGSHKMLTYYCLGNFTGTQKEVSEVIGGMAEITVQKDKKSGEIAITDYTMEPLVMHWDEKNKVYGVYELEQYTSKLAQTHSIHTYSDEVFTLDSIKKKYESELAGKISETTSTIAQVMEEESDESEDV